MTRHATLDRIAQQRLIMVLRSGSPDDAARAVAAAIAGGVRIVEVTFTVPEAPALIAELRARHGDELLIGAGTVLSAAQAEDAIAAGAEFLVSPGFDARLMGVARSNDVLMVPGTLSPSEVMAALRAGAIAVKLFPAEAVGPRYLRALLAPLPGLAVIPSGGISARNASEWISSGAIAVGIGGALSPAGAIDPALQDTITAEARRAVEAVHPRL